MANIDNQKITDCTGKNFRRKVYSVFNYKSGVTLGMINSTTSNKRSHRVTKISNDSWLVLGVAK